MSNYLDGYLRNTLLCREDIPAHLAWHNLTGETAIRSRLILLAVVIIALGSLLPVAAQTTECAPSFVNGLLRLTGTCGALPLHLQPPPEFTGTIDPTPDRNLHSKRNGKHRDKVQRRQDQKNVRRDREDTRRANEQATATATTLAGQQTATAAAQSVERTATAIARLTQVSLTATATARVNPKESASHGQGNAANDQSQAVLMQAASEREPQNGALAPTPTARAARHIQQTERRNEDRQQKRHDRPRNRNDRVAEARHQQPSGVFSPTPIPQLSPQPPFVNP